MVLQVMPSKDWHSLVSKTRFTTLPWGEHTWRLRISSIRRRTGSLTAYRSQAYLERWQSAWPSELSWRGLGRTLLTQAHDAWITATILEPASSGLGRSKSP